jgi:uncharacterized protein (DUF2249 family)
MEEQLVHTYTRKGWTAEVYSLSMPGEFQVVYRDNGGREVERVTITGVSTYHQREEEILDHLGQLQTGAPTDKTKFQDPGEY